MGLNGGLVGLKPVRNMLKPGCFSFKVGQDAIDSGYIYICIYIYICMVHIYIYILYIYVDLFICLFSEEDWDAYWKCHPLQRAAKVTPRLAIFFLISHPLSHTSLSDSLFILQQTLSKSIQQRLALPPIQLKNQHFLRFYYLWNFRHRLVWYYWYQLIKMKQRFPLHLDGDLGCRHDIGMTSWKLHLDGFKAVT